MERDKIRIRYFLLFFCFVLSAERGYSIISGIELLNKAQSYVGLRTYKEGNPPFKNYSGELINGYYRYGEYWRIRGRSQNDKISFTKRVRNSRISSCQDIND